MTPLFWIALSWVLCAFVVGRLPLQQRPMPGAMLLVAAVPIIAGVMLQNGFFAGVFLLGGLLLMFPNPVRLMIARYRGEKVRIDANVLRFLVVPGEL